VTTTRWSAVLDAFEARIAEQRTALDRGEAGDVPAFEPPGDLGPIPDALLARAAALALECDDLVAELAGNLAALRQDLSVAETVGASTGRTAGARLFDASA